MPAESVELGYLARPDGGGAAPGVVLIHDVWGVSDHTRDLAQRLTSGIAALPGVTMYSSTDASRYAAIMTFRPGTLDPRRLITTLYEKERIACAGSGVLRRSAHAAVHIFLAVIDC